MLRHQRDNDNDRLARIEILEDLRRDTEELHELATLAIERAMTQRLVSRMLIHDLREVRARRAEEKGPVTPHAAESDARSAPQSTAEKSAPTLASPARCRRSGAATVGP